MIELAGKLFLLHGPYKVGKTQTAASFPSPVQFIVSEPGWRYLPEKQKKRIIRLPPGKKGWEKIQQIADKNLVSRRKCGTVVFDTITPVYYMCMDWVCKENNMRHPSDGPRGKGWNLVAIEFAKQMSRIIDQCVDIEAAILWIDHSKVEEINTESETYNKIMCSMPGQARSLILPMPDHLWYLGYDETEGISVMKHTSDNRCLWIQGTPVVEAGTQDPAITDTGIGCIEDLPRSGQFDFILKRLNEKKKGKKHGKKRLSR